MATPRPALRTLLVGLVAGALLVGCSGGDDDAGDDAADSTTREVDGADVPFTPPTDATGAIDERAQYLALVAPSNCVGDQAIQIARDVLGDDGTATFAEWPAVQATVLPAYGARAAALAEFQTSLRSATWSPTLQPLIDALIVDLDRIRLGYEAAAATPSYEAFAQLTFPDTGTAATAVRAALQLPPPDVDGQDDIDWCEGPPER